MFGDGAVTAAETGAEYIPQYDHVVIVIMADKAASEIYGSSSAPYINYTLIPNGASFSNSYAVTHPAQLDYYALFSGNTQTTEFFNTCPQSFDTASLGQQLIDAGLGFVQYSEGLPSVGYTGCTSGLYTRVHNPAADFSGLATTVNRPFSDFAVALADSALPAVSFVVPNLCDDMHGDSSSCGTGTDLVALGDQWLQVNMGPYIASLNAQNSLLIVTWDEDDGTIGNNNRIATIFYGPHVKPGATSPTTITHYDLLRTLEDLFGLAPLGQAAVALPIADVWDDTIFGNGFE